MAHEVHEEEEVLILVDEKGELLDRIVRTNKRRIAFATIQFDSSQMIVLHLIC